MQLAQIAAANATADLANIINIGMVLVVGLGQAVTWAVMIRSGRRAAEQRAADAAASHTVETTGVKELAAANERIAAALEAQVKWAREHELADVRWQTNADAIMKQLAETAQHMARMMEGFQGQLVNIAAGRTGKIYEVKSEG